MNGNYDDCHNRKTMLTFLKAKKIKKRFYIQNAIHLTLRDFHGIFEVGIFIQIARRFALRWYIQRA